MDEAEAEAVSKENIHKQYEVDDDEPVLMYSEISVCPMCMRYKTRNDKLDPAGLKSKKKIK